MSGSDDGLTAFLNRLDDGGSYTLADPENPVQWGKLGNAILGSFFGIIALGVTNTFESIGKAWTTVLDGAREFVAGRDPVFTGYDLIPGTDGVLDVVFNPLIAAVTTAWNINVEQFGLLALPVAVGVTMGAFWVVMSAIAHLNGGEGL